MASFDQILAMLEDALDREGVPKNEDHYPPERLEILRSRLERVICLAMRVPGLERDIEHLRDQLDSARRDVRALESGGPGE